MGITLEPAAEALIKISVVGVGGGGCNAVSRMARSGMEDIQFLAVNTDLQSLAAAEAPHKVQIGAKVSGGKGCGNNSEIGRLAAEESSSVIAELLADSDMVFITAGMGGGTGTGAAPVIAELAKSSGALTVGVVTKPFMFEGRRRAAQAERGIKELMSHVDSLVIIPNDRLKTATSQRITLSNAFEIADSVLKQAIQSISDLIRQAGIINLDFADVSQIMKDAGIAHMGVGHASGKGKAVDAANAVITSPLLETSLNGAQGILINILGSEDMGLEEVETAAEMVRSVAHPDARIIFGAAFEPAMQDEMQITVIATGYDEEDWPRQIMQTPTATATVIEKPTTAPKTQLQSGGREMPEPDPWQKLIDIFQPNK